MNPQSASRAGAAIGAMIFSVFGSGWLVVWSNKRFGDNMVNWILIGLVGLSIVIAAYRQYSQNKEAHAAEVGTPENKRAEKIFHIVNAAQGVGIFLALNIVNNIGHPEWFIPAFIFIVGAHFIPLARVFKIKRHYVIGSAMMLFAVVYPQLASAGAADPVGCLGAGVILWLSAISGLLVKGD